MNLKALLTRFKADEDGAVTVDWVVLTAGLVGLAAIIGTSVATGVQTAGGKIQAGMEEGDQFTPTTGGTGGT
jgi:Flp pilus assembly pilin Flp